MDLIQYINKKEKEMEKEIVEIKDNGGIVDIQELANKVEIHPYFGMDSVSGDLVSFFNAANVVTVWMFCLCQL